MAGLQSIFKREEKLFHLEPSTNAVKVEGVVAHAPRDVALLGGGGRLLRLAFDAQVHDVVSADGAVVDDNRVPMGGLRSSERR